MKPTDGRITGAVFLGTGEFSLTPPVDVEKKAVAIFTNAPEVKEGFGALTMFFSDQTFEEVKASSAVQMGKSGTQSEKARSTFRAKEDLLKKAFGYNINSRTLADIYGPKERKGYFTAFIDGDKFGKLLYQLDPMGITEVYPEEVALISYDQGTGGIWTSFHLADEYKKRTAVSWQDNRTYDIKSHNIDATISGTRITAKDEVTLVMRQADSRFLPFDFFPNLRVSSVKDEAGNALAFIQEKPSEDADLGVILPAAKEIGKPFKLTFEYDGPDAIIKAGDGNFTLVPRDTWYPNNGYSAFGDRAVFDMFLRYPKKYVMVGVGSRVGEDKVEGDQKVSAWSSEGVELAVAGFNFGDFKMTQQIDPTTKLAIEVFANKTVPDELKEYMIQNSQVGAGTTSSNNDDDEGIDDGMAARGRSGGVSTTAMAKNVLGQAQNSILIYNSFFGKPPYKRFAMTQQPAGNYGQAWPTLVFLPYIAFLDTTKRAQLLDSQGGTDKFWTEVTAHEVAHQWWGHTLGWTSYHDQWMSEGFSEFSTSLYIQMVEKNVPRFISFWETRRKDIVTASPFTMGRKPFSVGPVTQGYRLNSAKTGNVARSMIYPKGAFILHMVRMMMYDHQGGTGDTRFRQMMQDFIKSNYNKDISTNDFKLAVEKYITPAMDIDQNKTMNWFFDQWVYGTEMPSYKLTYSVTKGADGKPALTGKIIQSGVSENFVMTVPIYVDYGKGWDYYGGAIMVGNETKGLSERFRSRARPRRWRWPQCRMFSLKRSRTFSNSFRKKLDFPRRWIYHCFTGKIGI